MLAVTTQIQSPLQFVKFLSHLLGLVGNGFPLEGGESVESAGVMAERVVEEDFNIIELIPFVGESLLQRNEELL